MTKRSMVVGVMLLVGLAGGIWYWVSSVPVSSDAAEPFVRENSPTPSSVPATHVGLNQEQVLPPISVPLKDVLPELRKLAEGGNSRAQCRIAAEMQKCRRARIDMAFSESYVRRAEARNSEADKKGGMMVIGQSSLESDLAHCDGVEEIDAVQVAQFWRRSALAGNREAMLRYATGNAFDMGSIVNLAGELQTYKNDAVAIARKAAAGGDGRAVIALASAYSPDSHIGAPTLLAQVTGIDVAQSLALFLYAERAGVKPSGNADIFDKFVRRRIDALRLAASPDQILWAEKQASELARTWVAPRLPSGNERAFLANAQYAPSAPEACEQL
jgi:hypothetical protein